MSDDCTMPLCLRPRRHHLHAHGVDSGAHLCCEHADVVMEKLAHVEDSNGGDGEAGLRSWIDAHRRECGNAAGSGLVRMYLLKRAAAERREDQK